MKQKFKLVLENTQGARKKRAHAVALLTSVAFQPKVVDPDRTKYRRKERTTRRDEY
jgi:hypothetical protein